jgi:hypothetical protein
VVKGRFFLWVKEEGEERRVGFLMDSRVGSTPAEGEESIHRATEKVYLPVPRELDLLSGGLRPRLSIILLTLPFSSAQPFHKTQPTLHKANYLFLYLVYLYIQERPFIDAVISSKTPSMLVGTYFNTIRPTYTYLGSIPLWQLPCIVYVHILTRKSLISIVTDTFKLSG